MFGGHCSSEVYSDHSCKNRSGPRCHQDQTQRWIAAREAELLACVERRDCAALRA
jgi:hypothetical protein